MTSFVNSSVASPTRLFFFFATAWSVVSLPTSGFTQSPGRQRPNLVFLMADDQCTYSMGCYDTPGADTPNLDRLAADGMIFDRHYVTTAICMASRATVMTGKHEFKTGCNFEHGPLLRTDWQQSYPVLLRKAGYRTAFAGKFGFEVAEVSPDGTAAGKGDLPTDDFDVWGGGPGQTSYDTAKNPSMKKYAEEYPHSTRSYGAFGCDFIKSSAQGRQPFCLSISFKAPHHPVTPDPLDDDVYAGAAFTKPANFGRDYGTHFAPQSRQGRQYERFHSWHYSDDYDGVMAKYYQQIYAIDVAVGMIRDAIREAGVSDDTVIVYTSDNGFMCGSHGYGSKVLPYEESSRVPLIVFDPRRWPERSTTEPRPIRRCDALTGNVDIAVTLLSLAGVQVPADVDGRDLSPLLDDPAGSGHGSLPLINVWGPEPVHSLAVVTDRWKFIRWPYQVGEFEATEELYDLRADPLERTNLAVAPSHRRELSEMRSLYDQWVNTWSTQGVRRHRYPQHASFFERPEGR